MHYHLETAYSPYTSIKCGGLGDLKVCACCGRFCGYYIKPIQFTCKNVTPIIPIALERSNAILFFFEGRLTNWHQ